MNPIYSGLSILTSAAVAYVAVNWVYFKILKIAKDKGLVDNPDARKLQKIPIPVMGGIAVFFGVVFGLMTATALLGLFNIASTFYMLPCICAMVVMLYTGAMDDILGLTPKSRFVIEIVTVLALILATGGCIDSFHGMWGIYNFSWWIAVPLTIVAGVGIINAVNMIDGVNGLSSGLCMLWCASFAVAFWNAGDISNAALAGILAASMLTFYIHNVFGLHSRMFVGDAGTMVMGIVMTWFTICLLRSDSAVGTLALANKTNMIALALAILSVPVFDTLRVMTMRMLKGKSPFKPDKTHLHHIFINIGISHAITSMIITIINLVIILIWAVFNALDASLSTQLYVVVVCGALLVWGTYAFMDYHVKHHTNLLHKLSHFSIRTHLGRKEWWKAFTRFLDNPERKYMDEVEWSMRMFSEQSEDERDLEAIDRQKIIGFMKGKAEVFVDDIEKFSGANPSRVTDILADGFYLGKIKVIREDSDGIPDIVAYVE